LPTAFRVDRTKSESSFIVDGRDSLKSIVEQDGRMEILDERGWWWVTEQTKGTESGASSWNVSYVEAFTLLAKP
jgi:hypothetical protein